MILDELVDLLFEFLFGWVPNAVWGALVLVVGLGLTIVGIGLLGESPVRGGTFVGIGVLAIAGVLAVWYR